MICIGATLSVVPLAAIVWSRHTMQHIPYWRESALHDETKTLTAVPLTERKSKLIVYS